MGRDGWERKWKGRMNVGHDESGAVTRMATEILQGWAFGKWGMEGEEGDGK